MPTELTEVDPNVIDDALFSVPPCEVSSTATAPESQHSGTHRDDLG